MATKGLLGRFKQKFDTLAKWTAVEESAVLLKGEIAVIEVPTDSTAVAGDTARPQYLFKVGDGTSVFKDLPYVSAKAADVYEWAKGAVKPVYEASEITGLSDYISGEIQDTNTVYQIVQDAEDGHKFTLQSKEVNGDWTDVTTITIPDNNTEYTLTSGVENGTVAFNGTDVAVTGLGSAAYTEASAYDVAGAAAAVLGEATDGVDANTVHGAKAAALAAQTKANDVDTRLQTVEGSYATTDYADQAEADALAEAKKYTDEKTAGLTGAMHFVGASTTDPEVGAPTVEGVEAFAKGDVILYSGLEFVFDGSNWIKFGDEGSYALKTQKINGHVLEGDITISAADVGAYTTEQVDAALTAKVEALDKEDTAVAGQVVSAVSEADGIITVERRALVADDIPELTAAKITDLATIATTGNVNDLIQTEGDYFIFDGGSSESII